MGCDGEHSFQISSLESTQALMKHAQLLSRTLNPPSKIEKKQWIVNNASNPQTRLRMRQLAEYLNELGITFPTVLWVIVAEYATVPTWLDTE